MNRKKWLWGALTAALVFALALAACGGGGDEPSAVAPPAWFVGKWYDDPSTHNLTTLVYDVRADGKILNAAGQVEGIITKVEGSGFVLTCYFYYNRLTWRYTCTLNSDTQVDILRNDNRTWRYYKGTP